MLAVPLLIVSSALAQNAPTVGIAEHLGQTIPADQMIFTDEAGQKVQLSTLLDKPVVLTLIYFGCPGICPRLLDEVAKAADQADARPGVDYRLISISFNPKDTPAIAAVRRDALLGTMTRKRPAMGDWRFLTGDPENIKRITDAVGFNYIANPNGVDFTHAATVVFLSREGKIVRYLNGLRIEPAEMELALADAKASRPRSFIQNIQELCYARDPKTGARQLAVDRFILLVTGVVAVTFLVYVLRQGRKRKRLLAEKGGL
ncbi:MAG: SCO family protein [Phycisphaerae bacterium]|nr:SCO family protein [Phycisphaerae bacterium]